MPAAAVIPAPIAYIKVAAVKKLVVGIRFASRAGRDTRRGVLRAVESGPDWYFPFRLRAASCCGLPLSGKIPILPVSDCHNVVGSRSLLLTG